MKVNLQGDYERANISSTTRSVLCVFASGDFARPIPRVNVDWKQVFAAVCKNGLIGLTYQHLNQNPALDYPPPEFRQQIQTAYRQLVLRMEILYRQISQVLTLLAQPGITAIVLKGPAFAHQVYPDPMLRSFNDLDLMVRENSWSNLHRVLIENGFDAAENWLQPPPKLVPQTSIYENKYWSRATKFLVEVHGEDIFNTGLIARDVDGFWQRAVTLELGKNRVRVPSLEDQLIHACVHLHSHGYTRLNWFADIAMLVRNHAARLDWERVIQFTRKEELQVGVYYTLEFTARLLGVAAPSFVLDALRPDRFRRWWHEFYLPSDKVVLLQRMPRPIFGFYFLPLLERLLPDLLVMGRRKEKFYYLLRLLFPPRAWLRSYYKLDNASYLLPHYFLHPFKLVYHYLAEIVTAPFARRRRRAWLESPLDD